MRTILTAGAVFLTALALLWFTSAHRLLLLNNDEGIYLDGALRILAGQAPYRDFFVLTGPGCFVLHSLAFGVFGKTLAAGRIIVLADLALAAAAIHALLAAFGRRTASFFVPALFLVAVEWQSGLVAANHRWDSSAQSFAAVVLVFFARRRSKWLTAAAGVLAASAAWITPPVALVGTVLFGWLASHRELRQLILPFSAGVLAVTAGYVAWLASAGAVVPMLDQILWTGANYTAPNHSMYGAVVGGYRHLFQDIPAAELPARLTVVFWIALPAILPLAVCVYWPLRLWRGSRPTDARILLLLVASIAAVLSCSPRPDLIHLLYVSPGFAVLAGLMLSEIPGRSAKLLVGGGLLALASLFAAHTASALFRESKLGTRLGTLRGDPRDLRLIENVTRAVRPGQSAFVFPYAPFFYFVTGAANPTRYSFLQPGMMTATDEHTALAELRAHPPEVVMYSNVKPEDYLRIWPSSDRSRLRLPQIEEFLSSEYVSRGRYRTPSTTIEIRDRRK